MSSRVRIKEFQFPADTRRWRVDWLGAVERGKTAANEPHIQVALRPILEECLDNPGIKLSSNSAVDHRQTKYTTIHCGQLPVVSIGSIWRNGYLQAERAGDPVTLSKLQIQPDKVRLVSANHTVQGKSLIPHFYYRYSGIGTDSWIAAIEHDGDPYRVLIPAMELLRFYYATSTRITRHLFAGDIRHNQNAIYNYEQSGYSESDDLVHLQLRQGLTREDGWNIARLVMSEDAYRGAVMLHDDMMKENINRQPVQVKSAFPFTGETTLKVRCKKIQSLEGVSEDPWRHLVLSIDECSAPFPFTRLAVTLDNNNDKAAAETDIADNLKKRRYGNTGQDAQTEDVHLQSQDTPNTNVAGIEVPLPGDRFTAIKDKEIERLPKELCQYKSSKLKLPSPQVDEYSTESSVNNGASVGQANLNSTRQREESIGVCFNAFTDAIAELSGREGYRARLRSPDNTVRYIPLTNAASYYQWSYLDSASQTRRAVIAADIQYKGDWYTLVDFQLRSSDKCRVGLIRKVSGGYLLTGDLEVVLKRLAREKGVWSNTNLTGLAVEIETLKHTWPDEQRFADAVERKISDFIGVVSQSTGAALT